MTNVRSLAISATAVLLLVAGTGCANNGDDPASSRPTRTSSPADAPSTSKTPTGDSDVAATAAESVVREYFATVDQLRQRPRMPLADLKGVATSGELSAQQRLIQTERQKGQRQVGDTRIGELKVQSVNLDNSDPQAGKVPTVQVDVCWNVSAVDVVDKKGESIVSPSRADSGWIRFTVANYHYSTNPDGGWRVASSQDLKGTPCTAS